MITLAILVNGTSSFSSDSNPLISTEIGQQKSNWKQLSKQIKNGRIYILSLGQNKYGKWIF